MLGQILGQGWLSDSSISCGINLAECASWLLCMVSLPLSKVVRVLQRSGTNRMERERFLRNRLK